MARGGRNPLVREGQELLTVEQVCRILGISRRTLYREIIEGRLLSVKVGYMRRVLRKDLDAYIERLRTESQAEAQEAMAAGS